MRTTKAAIEVFLELPTLQLQLEAGAKVGN
jgi:hypothetical protein